MNAETHGVVHQVVRRGHILEDAQNCKLKFRTNFDKSWVWFKFGLFSTNSAVSDVRSLIQFTA
jgi:hypothetical protein